MHTINSPFLKSALEQLAKTRCGADSARIDTTETQPRNQGIKISRDKKESRTVFGDWVQNSGSECS